MVYVNVQNHLAAINLATWPQSTSACGDCVEIRCTDPNVCSASQDGTDRTIVAQIIDDCGGCEEGKILMNSSGMDELFGENVNGGFDGVSVQWRPISCRQHTEGSLHLHINPQGGE